MPVTGLATRLIDSPLIAVLLIGVALAVSTVLVRTSSSIRRTLSHVELHRQTSIDGLRGFLGIGVFVHHTVITWFFLHGSPWQLPPSRFVVHLGQTSVALFFMITAFLFWGRVLDRGSRIDWTEFVISRLYRLYPVYLLMVALLLATALAAATLSRPPTSGPVAGPLLDWVLFTLFDAPNLDGLPGTGLLVAGVTWSLRYEWLFYLALPLIGFLTGRSRQPVAALVSAAVVALILQRLHWQTFSPRILLPFVGGIVAAHWVRVERLAALGQSRAAGAAALAALAGVVTLLPGAYSWLATPSLAVFFVVIASGHSLWGLLRLPGLLWLGDITYSIYLLHGLFLWLVLQGFLPHPLATSPPVFLASVVTIDAMLVLVSSLIFMTIERPAVLLGKRHARWFGANASKP